VFIFEVLPGSYTTHIGRNRVQEEEDTEMCMYDICFFSNYTNSATNRGHQVEDKVRKIKHLLKQNHQQLKCCKKIIEHY